MISVNAIADTVAMMNEGYIHFEGTPAELRNSKDKIVKEFLERTETVKTRV